MKDAEPSLGCWVWEDEKGGAWEILWSKVYKNSKQPGYEI